MRVRLLPLGPPPPKQTPEVHDLSKRFNFDVSMFERLAKSPDKVMEPVCLLTQARMRKEFAGLLKKVYPDLRTNEARVAGNQVCYCCCCCCYCCCCWDSYSWL
jgi:hypothetical protein